MEITIPKSVPPSEPKSTLPHIPKSVGNSNIQGSEQFGILDRSSDSCVVISTLNGIDGESPNVHNGQTTSTPIRPSIAPNINISVPEDSAIVQDDSNSEKECPTEFRIEDSLSVINIRGLQIPILGYEIMEERAKFTVFKLHVRKSLEQNWFVFRRYTDFIWLNDQLKVMFPVFRLNLPPKRWFGDNFERKFLDERQANLQAFLNNVMGHREVSVSQPVSDFLCLDDPPGPHESLEESRAMCECLEDSMYTLRCELSDKESKIAELEDVIEMYKSKVESLEKVLDEEKKSKTSSFEKPPVKPRANSDLGLSRKNFVDGDSLGALKVTDKDTLWKIASAS